MHRIDCSRDVEIPIWASIGCCMLVLSICFWLRVLNKSVAFCMPCQSFHDFNEGKKCIQELIFSCKLMNSLGIKKKKFEIAQEHLLTSQIECSKCMTGIRFIFPPFYQSYNSHINKPINVCITMSITLYIFFIVISGKINSIKISKKKAFNRFSNLPILPEIHIQAQVHSLYLSNDSVVIYKLERKFLHRVNLHIISIFFLFCTSLGSHIVYVHLNSMSHPTYVWIIKCHIK